MGLDPTAVDLMRLNQTRTFTESVDLIEVEEVAFTTVERACAMKKADDRNFNF